MPQTLTLAARPASRASARATPFASRGRALLGHATPALAFAAATLLTNAWFLGDTSSYVGSLLARAGVEMPGAEANEFPFWEFGHLLWRPLGRAADAALRPLTELAVGQHPAAQATLALMALNWIAGLAAAVAFGALLARLGVRRWAAGVAAVAFACGNAFLNYAQTGCSYVPGLAFFVVALYLLAPRADERDVPGSNSADELSGAQGGETTSESSGARSGAGAGVARSDDSRSALRASLAGASLALSILMWFPYVLVVPGALALPVLFGAGAWRGRLRQAVVAAAACGLLTAAAYAVVSLGPLNQRAPSQFLAWAAESSHGYKHAGLPRLAFGFARSFIHTGQDGLLLKRYLIGDPYSPVSLPQLFRLSLWKLALFYLALAGAAVALARSARGRRIGFWALIQIAPVFFFALFLFEAGMPERYLPLYPAVFAAFAFVASSVGAWARWPRVVVLLFLAALVVSDLAAMRAGALERQHEVVFARVGDLGPRLTRESLVAVTHLQDEVSSFYHNFPFHPLNRRGVLRIYSVTEPGSERNLTWRQDFAEKVLGNWRRGGDVWLSRRLFAERPRPEWNWAEGDDRRISWAHLGPLFSQIETTDAAGGDDGFVLLARTPRNEELLRAVAREPRPAKE